MGDLLVLVESIKNMMVARATGSPEGGKDYKIVRGQLVGNVLISDRLPRFVKTCRTLDEFWGHIREVSETYAGAAQLSRRAVP